MASRFRNKGINHIFLFLIDIILSVNRVEMEYSDTPLELVNLNREELIKVYFIRGLSYDEILNMLSKYHNIVISKRHLHRLLRNQNLS